MPKTTANHKPQAIANLKELREDMEQFIERVGTGETITIYRRSKPIFKLTPVEDQSENWETVVDFVKETGRGVAVEDLLASLQQHGQKPKVS